MAGFRGGFGGFGGGNQMQQLMKQAQKMQADMEKAQRELEEMEIESESASGLIKVIMNGKKVVKSVTIDPNAVDTDDIEMLEDLIVAATNEALKQVEAASASAMSKLTGGFGGGMPGMPF